MISVVIPTLNAERSLRRTLDGLVGAAAEGLVREVIVADGGSDDATRDMAETWGAKVVKAAKGRGTQLAAGAKKARSDWMLFLHADTRLQRGWTGAARDFIRQGKARAGVFRFALDDEAEAARRLETMVSLRCSVLGLPYGDQGLLISRRLYDKVGGFSAIPLFEDVDMVRRLGRKRLAMLNAKAVTSAERFRKEGYLKRSARNLALLAQYYAGVKPEVLARAYD